MKRHRNRDESDLEMQPRRLLTTWRILDKAGAAFPLLYVCDLSQLLVVRLDDKNLLVVIREDEDCERVESISLKYDVRPRALE